MTSTVVRLGVHLRARGSGPDPRVLLGLALRDNPRRAQLLVSRVLGKHIPTDPRVVHAAGLLLGELVADVLGGRPPRPLPVDLLHAAVRGSPDAAAELHAAALRGVAGAPVDALVLGFAETATALGHCVAEALGGADYLHSTRRPVAGVATAGAFVEEHSHHTGHLLLPSDAALLADPRPLVLVDDELSTGRTAVNTIAALHSAAPRAHYVLATLVDLRAELAGLPDGVRVDVVALTGASLTLPADLAERAAALRAELGHAARVVAPTAHPVSAPTGVTPASAPVGIAPTSAPVSIAPTSAPVGVAAGRATASTGARTGPSMPANPAAPPHRRVLLADLGWPTGLPAGGRHGFTAAHHRLFAAALPGLAAGLARAADIRPGERTLVLGTEELMAAPLRLAVALVSSQQGDIPATGSEECAPAAIAAAPPPRPGVWFSTTTRSPAVVVDEPDYALANGICFPSHDDPADGPGPRFAYNVAQPWDHVLVMVDPPADTPVLRTGLLTALGPHTRRTTVVVTP